MYPRALFRQQTRYRTGELTCLYMRTSFKEIRSAGSRALGDESIHEEDVIHSLRLDKLHGSTERQFSFIEFTPGVGDPAGCCQTAPECVIQVPKGSAGS